jgi:hypothetical protein
MAQATAPILDSTSRDPPFHRQRVRLPRRCGSVRGRRRTAAQIENLHGSEHGWAGPPSHDKGQDEGEQFNGGKPDDQQCKRYRIVSEPNTHDVPPIIGQQVTACCRAVSNSAGVPTGVP